MLILRMQIVRTLLAGTLALIALINPVADKSAHSTYSTIPAANRSLDVFVRCNRPGQINWHASLHGGHWGQAYNVYLTNIRIGAGGSFAASPLAEQRRGVIIPPHFSHTAVSSNFTEQVASFADSVTVNIRVARQGVPSLTASGTASCN
jgi:hypothetical protein